MKISTKARYGLRVMLELALNYNKRLVQVKEIAEKQDLSEKYVEQIIITLRTGNLIKSVRGAKGGYYLNREPKDITLKEIVERLEGPLYPVDCAENPSICNRSAECITIDVWKKIGLAVQKILEQIHLEQLVQLYDKKKNSEMYYI